MATSSYSGRIPLAATELTDDDFFDTAMAATVANNAQHFADQVGQVRVCWAALASQVLTTQAIGAGDVDTFLPIAIFGPFPLTIKANGDPYLMRIRMAGSASAANSITLRAALCPVRGTLGARGLDFVRSQIEANGANVLSASTSSTTGAWLSGGTTVNASNLTSDATTAERWTVEDSVGGTTHDTEVTIVSMAIHVWGSSTTAATQPELVGLYAAEYVGT